MNNVLMAKIIHNLQQLKQIGNGVKSEFGIFVNSKVHICVFRSWLFGISSQMTDFAA